MGNVTRIKEVKASLAKAKAHQAKGLRRGLYKAGLLLQRLSMQLVPIQTGQLRESSDVIREGTGLHVSVSVIYATEYAVYVHEDMDAAHGAAFNSKHADKIKNAKPGHKIWFNRGTKQQAKFLEQPFRENRAKLASIVRHEIELTI